MMPTITRTVPRAGDDAHGSDLFDRIAERALWLAVG